MSAMEKLKGVGIIRVSTATQAGEDHFGPRAQESLIQRLAKQHAIELVEVVSYADVSGADVIFAPEMQHVLRLIQRQDITAVVAAEFSRLVRPGFEDYPLLQKFVEANITLYLPSGPIKLADAHGQFFATIHGAMASLERHTIKSRLHAGREESRKLGYAAAGGRTVPTGVTWDVKTKTYAYDRVYAPVIREAFHMFANGETCYQTIIDKLQVKLRPASGAPKLANVTALRRVFQNRMYIGERVIDKKFDQCVPRESRLFRGKDGKLHKKNPPLIAREPHEVYVRRVIDPPLVSPEIFERVQAVLRAKTDERHQQHARRIPTQFAYRGLLFCAECGSPLYTIGAGKHSYYRCRKAFTKWAAADRCKSPSLHRAELDAACDQFFAREFTKMQFFKDLLHKQLGSDERKAKAERKAHLKIQLDALAKKRKRIIEAFLDGTLMKPDRDRRLLALDAEDERTRRELVEVSDVSLPTYAEWQQLLKPFRHGFSGLPSTEKRRLITSRFQDIRVKDYRIVSLYLLTGEPAAIRPSAPLETHCDPTRCAECGMSGSKVRDGLCDPCQDAIAGLREEERKTRLEGLEWPSVPPESPVFGPNPAFVETSQRL